MHAEKEGIAGKARGGLAMRLWSQGPLQSPIQNFNKEAFWRNFGSLFDFFVLYVISQKHFDLISPLGKAQR
jgi:hypothetical protein